MNKVCQVIDCSEHVFIPHSIRVKFNKRRVLVKNKPEPYNLYKKYQYCHTHKCKVPRCSRLRQKDRVVCLKHNCQWNRKCSNAPTRQNQFCLYHQCQYVKLSTCNTCNSLHPLRQITKTKKEKCSNHLNCLEHYRRKPNIVLLNWVVRRSDYNYHHQIDIWTKDKIADYL